ncbi:MAG: DUF3253 domain-containing protein [Nitriliruptoraceae bacterium]
MATPPDKVCASCGRAFAWRKAWARDWDRVRYCSDACRRRKVRPVDRALEAAIRELLDARAAGATICPSEAARRVAAAQPAPQPAPQPSAGSAGAEAWRELLEPARRAARRLVASGEVELTQRGRVVDPSSFRGPVRIRRAGRR